MNIVEINNILDCKLAFDSHCDHSLILNFEFTEVYNFVNELRNELNNKL